MTFGYDELSNVFYLLLNECRVFLKCDLPELEARIKDSKNRPKLTSNTSLKEELQMLWKKRKDKYLSSADMIFNTSSNQTLEEKAESIIMLI